MSTSVQEFEVPNVAAGPDPFSLSDVAGDETVDAVVLLLQRDYHCTKCRDQVQTVAERYDDFRAEDAVVAAVLPEPVDRAADWQDRYDLPFPLLADGSKTVGETYDQPTRFGALGALHDLVGRMPKAVVVDARSRTPEVAAVHEGSMPADRPDVDDLLEAAAEPDDAALRRDDRDDRM